MGGFGNDCPWIPDWRPGKSILSFASQHYNIIDDPTVRHLQARIFS